MGGKTVIGIDPGLTGAMVLLRDETVLRIVDMPLQRKVHGKGHEVNAYILVDELNYLCGYGTERPIVRIERVGARPGQGVTSMFSFGRSAGVVEGVVAALGLQTEYVTPQTWKRNWNLIGTDKDAARTLAIALHPDIAYMLARKKDCGRADAILIATSKN